MFLMRTDRIATSCSTVNCSLSELPKNQYRPKPHGTRDRSRGKDRPAVHVVSVTQRAEPSELTFRGSAWRTSSDSISNFEAQFTQTRETLAFPRMPDLEKDPQGWWSSSTAAPTTSPAVVAPPPPKLQKTATARPSQSRYAAQPATTVVPPPVPSPSAPKSSLRATPLPPSKPKPSQSIYAATPAVAVPPNQYAPARKQAQPRVSPSFATNVNKSAIPTGPRTALPTPPVITNAPTASTSTVSPTVVVPPRELPNKNRSATGAAVRVSQRSSLRHSYASYDVAMHV